MKQISKVSNLLVFALLIGLTYADPTNSTWNYATNGTEWNDTYAACAAKWTVESPIDYKYDWSTYGTSDSYVYDWSTDFFSFLPVLANS